MEKSLLYVDEKSFIVSVIVYLRKNSNENNDRPSRKNCKPNTRIVTRNRLGFLFFAFLIFISSSHALHSLSPSTSDLWFGRGLYKSLESNSCRLALRKTGNIQL